MATLGRLDWYEIARTTNWTPKYVKEDELFPPEMSNSMGLPISAWETYDEPYKQTYPEWHFQIRRVPHGQATDRFFHHLKLGDEIEIDGPYGLAWLREDSPRDIVCAAGGSGLAPMVSIARGASASGMLATRHLHFFYGGRTPRDICGESFLSELPEFGSRIHFHPAVSMPEQDPDSSWDGETGFVHEVIRRRLDGHMSEFEFYFAGPPPMTQALQEMLMVGYRVPFEQVHFDRFF